jgi:hypothetical protein
MVFVAGAGEADPFDWELPAWLFNDEGEMKREPEPWEPEDSGDPEWETTSARKANAAHARRQALDVDG